VEMILVCFKLLYQQSPGESEDNH